MEKEIIIFKGIEFYKIPNVEGYFVSKCGKVYSTKTNIIMKPRLTQDGYERLQLRINNKRKFICVHQLVGIVFLGLEVDNMLYSISKLQVNHINEIKTDNNLENLELVTVRQNKLHSSKGELGIKGVTINKNYKTNPFQAQIYINTKINLGYYSTAEDAGRIHQIALQNIHLFDGDKKKFRNLIKNTYEIEKEYI